LVELEDNSVRVVLVGILVLVGNIHCEDVDNNELYEGNSAHVEDNILQVV
jgi:hypothetical protein